MAFLTETRITRRPSKSVSRKLTSLGNANPPPPYETWSILGEPTIGRIAVRIRPLKPDETGRIIHAVDDQVVLLEENETDKNDVLRHNRGSDRQYVFDTVFGENSTQEQIFEKTTKALVHDVLQGYNSTIFAYGASGSGKTHTMLGTSTEPGIMVRALHEIFNFVEKADLPHLYNVTMSYLEIYNENIRDLLNPDLGFLELREDQKEKAVHVVRLTEVSTNSTEEMIRLLQKGNRARTMEPTALNKTSSRSHALLSINVRRMYPMQKNEKLKARVKQGKLFMIDLAGSERASQTKNRGRRLVEGAHINRSLLALGNCINALSGGARYVNYRDSKLTRLLKDALSGNSQTCMIAHVSPAMIHREESKNTLLYAERAKTISNKVEKNILDISYHVSQYRTIISELRDEIARLKSKMPEDKIILPPNKRNRLQQYPKKPKIVNRFGEGANGIADAIAEPIPEDAEDNKGDKQEEFAKEKSTAHNTTFSPSSSGSNPEHMAKLKSEIIATFKEQMKLRKRLFNIDCYLMELDSEAERQRAVIAEWEGKYHRLYTGNLFAGKEPEKPDLESLNSDYQEIERYKGSETLEKILLEMTLLEKEQEKYTQLRIATESELEKCKEKADMLEKNPPYEINSEEERELLSLIIRVHELEIDKMVLQSERMTRDNALRQQDLIIMRYDRQRQICEEIITRQRKIMEDGKIALPADLRELYRVYEQTIRSDSHPSTGNTGGMKTNRLPPIFKRSSLYDRIKTQTSENLEDSDQTIRTPSSSPGSDWTTSSLPPISVERIRYTSAARNLPPPSVLFPPIARLRQGSR